MQFDIVRAWKDEAYYQSLSAEQLSTLPTNPAGELTDMDLATVSGGGGFPGAAGAAGVAGAAVPAVPAIPALVTSGHVRNESLAVICEINVFSISAVISNIAILGSVTQVCIKG